MWHDLSAICKKPCLCDLTPRGWKHNHNSLTVPGLDALLLVRQCHIQKPSTSVVELLSHRIGMSMSAG